jgi:hypothetical protein
VLGAEQGILLLLQAVLLHPLLLQPVLLHPLLLQAVLLHPLLLQPVMLPPPLPQFLTFSKVLRKEYDRLCRCICTLEFRPCTPYIV